MTFLDLLLEDYILEKTKTDWKDYGILEWILRDKYDNKRYKAIVKDNDAVIRPLSFVPIPTKISQQITHEIAQKLNMEIIGESDNNGYSYFARLVSRARKRFGEVAVRVVDNEEAKELKCSDIAMMIDIDNVLAGSFKVSFFIIRCEPAFMDGVYPLDSKELTVKKTYNVEKMKNTILEKAQEYKKKFDNYVYVHKTSCGC